MKGTLLAVSLDRMANAMNLVQQRLLHATGILQAANIEYAVAGGNAVAAWVSTIDRGAVRSTNDVDILLRRADFERAKVAFESAGLTHRHLAGVDVFLDKDDPRPREAVHIVFAQELVRSTEAAPNPDVTDSVDSVASFRVLSLEALVRIKLTAYRDKDRTHLRDLLDVGLIGQTWVPKLIPELGARLQHLIDTPGG